MANAPQVRAMPGVIHVVPIATGVAVRAETFGQCIDAVNALDPTWNAGTVDGEQAPAWTGAHTMASVTIRRWSKARSARPDSTPTSSTHRPGSRDGSPPSLVSPGQRPGNDNSGATVMPPVGGLQTKPRF